MRERLLSARRTLYNAVVNEQQVGSTSFLTDRRGAILTLCRYRAIGRSLRQLVACSGMYSLLITAWIYNPLISQSFLPLSQQQCVALRDQWHVHLPETGRINVAGLNSKNIDYVAKAIKNVVKGGKSQL